MHNEACLYCLLCNRFVPHMSNEVQMKISINYYSTLEDESEMSPEI